MWCQHGTASEDPIRAVTCELCAHISYSQISHTIRMNMLWEVIRKGRSPAAHVRLHPTYQGGGCRPKRRYVGRVPNIFVHSQHLLLDRSQCRSRPIAGPVLGLLWSAAAAAGAAGRPRTHIVLEGDGDVPAARAQGAAGEARSGRDRPVASRDLAQLPCPDGSSVAVARLVWSGWRTTADATARLLHQPPPRHRRRTS
jgi:hypothetical protein